MRIYLTLLLILPMSLVAAPANAQPKQDKVPAKPTSRTILANLESPHKAFGQFADKMKLSELLNLANEVMAEMGRPVTIAVDDEAYREDNPEFEIYETEIRLKNLPASPMMLQVLRQAVKTLPVKSALVIRAGKVEIVPMWKTAKEHMLNQTVRAEFSDRPLDKALEELSELTGVSIVMDGRAKQKAQAAVSARFHDDVVVQDAVRILTDMAELKIVYLVTGIYVTTPEHAKVMQKELKELYGIPTNVAPMSGIGGPPVEPMIGMPPFESPLAPPLPPLVPGKHRLEPAA